MPSFDRIAFVLSVAILAFLYGIATQAFGWFPSTQLRRAWVQAERLSPLSFKVTNVLTGQTKYDWLTERVFSRQGVRNVRPNSVSPGVKFVATMEKSNDWKPELRLVNAAGKGVHEWNINPSKVFTEAMPRHPDFSVVKRGYVHGSHLSPNGDLIVNFEYLGGVKVNACGDIQWSLPALTHHSIDRADDGSYWIPAVTHPDVPLVNQYSDTFPGIGRPSFQNLILHVSEGGEITDAVNVLQVLYENGLDRQIPKLARGEVSDITHLNDVESLPDSLATEYQRFEAGDLLLSLRNLDLVLVLDPDSRTVKWHESRHWIRQHDPDFMGNGWIGVFDNNVDGTDRGTMLGGSRIVAIQPRTDSVRVLFPKVHSDELYTSYGGKWSHLRDGNIFLVESEAARILEVSPDGRTVWEWVNSPYNEATVPEILDAKHYNYTEERIESWRCPPDSSSG